MASKICLFKATPAGGPHTGSHIWVHVHRCVPGVHSHTQLCIPCEGKKAVSDRDHLPSRHPGYHPDSRLGCCTPGRSSRGDRRGPASGASQLLWWWPGRPVHRCWGSPWGYDRPLHPAECSTVWWSFPLRPPPHPGGAEGKGKDWATKHTYWPPWVAWLEQDLLSWALFPVLIFFSDFIILLFPTQIINSFSVTAYILTVFFMPMSFSISWSSENLHENLNIYVIFFKMYWAYYLFLRI